MIFELIFKSRVEKVQANSWGQILSERPELVSDLEFICFKRLEKEKNSQRGASKQR
jgi:hypothetical protein